METKRCICCGRELPLSDFKVTGKGRMNTCESCWRKHLSKPKSLPSQYTKAELHELFMATREENTELRKKLRQDKYREEKSDSSDCCVEKCSITKLLLALKKRGIKGTLQIDLETLNIGDYVQT